MLVLVTAMRTRQSAKRDGVRRVACDEKPISICVCGVDSAKWIYSVCMYSEIVYRVRLCTCSNMNGTKTGSFSLCYMDVCVCVHVMLDTAALLLLSLSIHLPKCRMCWFRLDWYILLHLHIIGITWYRTFIQPMAYIDDLPVHE